MIVPVAVPVIMMIVGMLIHTVYSTAMSTSPVAGTNPAAASAALDTTRWAYVWLLLACGIGASMQVGKVPPALGFVQRDLHLGLVVGAWVISMFSVVGATLPNARRTSASRSPRRAARAAMTTFEIAWAARVPTLR